MGPEEVRPDHVVGSGVQACHHRGLGGALSERVDVTGLLEVGGLANVTVNEGNARLAQARDVELDPRRCRLSNATSSQSGWRPAS